MTRKDGRSNHPAHEKHLQEPESSRLPLDIIDQEGEVERSEVGPAIGRRKEDCLVSIGAIDRAMVMSLTAKQKKLEMEGACSAPGHSLESCRDRDGWLLSQCVCVCKEAQSAEVFHAIC